MEGYEYIWEYGESGRGSLTLIRCPTIPLVNDVVPSLLPSYGFLVGGTYTQFDVQDPFSSVSLVLVYSRYVLSVVDSSAYRV